MNPKPRPTSAEVPEASEQPGSTVSSTGHGRVLPGERDRGVSGVRARAANDEQQGKAFAILASHQAGLLQVIAALLEASHLTSASMSICEALQQRFDCTRVAIGLVRNGKWTASAISQQAHIDESSPEVVRLLAAMREATDAEQSIRFPSGADRALLTQHHESICNIRGPVELLSVPLLQQDRVLGALYLERDVAWPDGALRWLEQLAVAVAPLLNLRARAEQGPLARARSQFKDQIDILRQPKRILFKVLTLSAIVSVPLLLALPVTNNVIAQSELVTSQKRLITAPQAGYVSEVLVSSGENVAENQLLVRLDRGDLGLEAKQQQKQMHQESRKRVLSLL